MRFVSVLEIAAAEELSVIPLVVKAAVVEVPEIKQGTQSNVVVTIANATGSVTLIIGTEEIFSILR